MSKDLKTLVEKELEKGSTPLVFDSLIVPPEGFREIESREREIESRKREPECGE